MISLNQSPITYPSSHQKRTFPVFLVEMFQKVSLLFKSCVSRKFFGQRGAEWERNMGVQQSIEKKTIEIEQSIDRKINQRAMIQREIQMSVGLAQARDSLMWFGSLYSIFITGLSSAILLKKSVPKVVALPVVLGGFGLLNLYDFAYGSKITRVAKEAEFILDNERYRLIPPLNAPFSGLYEAERNENHPFVTSEAVGSYWPSFLPMSRKPKE
jgi:hypothetical protein